jgi:hypothetical protein
VRLGEEKGSEEGENKMRKEVVEKTKILDLNSVKKIDETLA